MGKTKIQWTDYSWPVINGCMRKSAGCENCYAERLTATRLSKTPKYGGLAVMKSNGPHWTGDVRLHEKSLLDPLRIKKPSRIFVCDMGDLFYEAVPDEWIDKVFAVMALAPQHTFQLLSKRPDRMREYLSNAAPRVAALVYNSRYGQRSSIYQDVRGGRTGDRRQGPDLASPETSRSRGQAGGRLLSGLDGQPMRTSQGRVSHQRWLSTDSRDRKGSEDGDRGTPSGLGLLQQETDPEWTDNQSQTPERRQDKQRTGKLRVSDIQRATQTRIGSPKGEKKPTKRVAASQNSPHGIRRSGDKATTGSGSDGQGHCDTVCDEEPRDLGNLRQKDVDSYLTWPLPNVWLGVSCEDQATAEQRIPILMHTPAAKTFISAEPLLGPIDLEMLTHEPDDGGGWVYRHWNALDGSNWCDCQDWIHPIGTEPLSWVIVGGESGPGARSLDLAWLKAIVTQCQAAKVPVFVKQLGYRPWWDGVSTKPPADHVYLENGVVLNGKVGWQFDLMKDRKGGLIDEWPEDLKVREFPA